jgi:hypothetical protein
VSAPAIIIMILALLGGLAVLYAAFRMWRRTSPDAILREVEEVKARIEPEDPQEQTMITPAAGTLVDPEAAKVIGNPMLRWGKPERRRFIQEDYEGAIRCLLCTREILPGQFFWETPLIKRATGEEIDTSFQLCLSCQPGDVVAVIHRDA